MNPINRRDFIGLTLAGGAALISQQKNLWGAPPLVRVRRNLAILENPQKYSAIEVEAIKKDVDALKKGVEAMKGRGPNPVAPDNFRHWYRQAEIHKNYCSDVHSSWLFLPWHRAYIYYFEQIIAQLSGYQNFSLPYWDWTTLKLPGVFWEEPLKDVFPNWDDSRAQTRDRFITPNTLADVNKVGEKALRDLVNVKKEAIKGDFISFFGKPRFSENGSGKLENIHRYIHSIYVKGNMSNNNTTVLDPIFWAHHANVDRIWVQWVQNNPKRQNTTGTNWSNLSVGTVAHFRDMHGDMQNPKVGWLSNTFNLGYRYDTQSESFNPVIPNRNHELVSPQFSVEGIPINSDGLVGLVSQIPNISQKGNLINSVNQVSQTPSSNKNSSSIRLTVEVEKPENSEITAMVFINPPSNQSELTVDSVSYIGIIYFFEGGHAHSSVGANKETRRFLFNATETIQRLRKTSGFDLQEAVISIVPIIPEGVSGSIKMTSFKFELVS